MSLPVTAIPHNPPDFDAHHPPPPSAPKTKPTPLEQMDALASLGFSPQQIATRLEIPLSQVDATLGIQAAQTAPAPAFDVAPVRLSLHA